MTALRIFLLATGIAGASLTGSALADAKLSSLFTKGAVLQQGSTIPVWGTATAGESVLVRLGSHQATARANQEGQWRVEFPAMPASGNALELKVTARNELKVHPIWIGDVLIAAGGLAWQPQGNLPKGGEEPSIAVFQSESKGSFLPQNELQGRWQSGGGKASAFAISLARELVQRTKAPVGIIVLQAASPLESWIPRDMLEQNPAAKPILDFHAQSGLAKQIEQIEADYAKRMEAWIKAGEQLPLEPEDAPTPKAPKAQQLEAPAVNFNGLVAPLAGLPVRGMIWDHGEDNASTVRAAQYGKLLPSALAGFRRNAGQPEMVVTIVQRRSERNRLYDDRAGADLREAQAKAQNFPATVVVPTVDLGHNPKVATISERVIESFFSQHRKDRAALFPSLATHERRGSHILLTFKDTSGPLRFKDGPAKGLIVKDGQRWVWAGAVARDNQIAVSAPGVSEPSEVRYAWQDLPQRGANLYDGRNRPVLPFRTDSDKLTTAGTTKPDQFPRHSLLGELYIEDSRLPRVLLIGDSIAIGQIDTMRRLLAGKANVLVGNNYQGSGFYTSAGALKDDTLAKFLQSRGPFHVIQFNMGVHEFASDTTPEKGSVGYANRLRKVVQVFREHAPNAHLVWCSSTGTRGDGVIQRFPKYLTSAKAYNAAAAEVMKEMNVAVSDLFAYTQPKVNHYISGDNIHLRNEVKAEITEFLARNILPHLPAPLPSP